MDATELAEQRLIMLLEAEMENTALRARVAELAALPGWTCPAIDRAQRVMRRLAWRVKHRPEAPEDEIGVLLAEGLRALETVREENKALRRVERHHKGQKP